MATDPSTAFTEFKSYSEQGHLLLAVTLSTKIKNTEEGERFMESQHFRALWEQHLIGQFEKLLPKRKTWSLDHWYRIHSAPSYHFHGIVAIHKDYAERVWSNGVLRKRLFRTLNSWRRNRQSTRPCEVAQFHISRLANSPDECAEYNSWGADAISFWMNYATAKSPKARVT
jgi:hypothetical protein